MDKKVHVVFIVGGPGAGKGTACKVLKEEFKYNHLSTGDILRNIVKEQKNPKWKELQEKMNSGAFVSSSELMGFVKDEFKALAGQKVLLDGFPRNQENVDEWNKQMNDVADVKALLYLDCKPETMKKRMLVRNEGRADDNEETMKKRIENFVSSTIPVVEEFKKTGKVISVDAEKTAKEVYEEIAKKFKEKGL